MRQNWLAALSNLAALGKKFSRLKVSLIQFFPVSLPVITLLAYAECNFVSV